MTLQRVLTGYYTTKQILFNAAYKTELMAFNLTINFALLLQYIFTIHNFVTAYFYIR